MSVAWFNSITFTFEVGWADDPSTEIGSTTWTDESARVMAVSCRRGRNSELDTFTAGTLQVTLTNADRRFDPNYAAGALYGTLLPMRRARLKLTYNAVEYPIWSGFIDDLPQQYDIGGRFATVTIPCTDGFKVLNLLSLPESVHAAEFPADLPFVWWRLGETSGTTMFDSSGHGYHGTYEGGATANSTAGLIYGGTDAAISFDGSDDRGRRAGGLIFAQPFTIEGWISWTDAVTVAPTIYSQSTGTGASSTNYITVRGTTLGEISAVWQEAAGLNVNSALTAGGYDDGLPHHVVAVFGSGTTAPDIYVDGALVSTTDSSAGSTPPFPLGQATVGYNELLGYGEGTVDEVAVYASTALSAGTIEDHYVAGAIPGEGALSGDRIAYLLTLAGWPIADTDLAVGVSTMQSLATAGQTALGKIQATADSEQGQLFMGADGVVVFRDRHWRFENTKAINSQATFGDSGSELRYSDIVTDGGEQFLFNRVRASRTGGAIVDVSDSASITKFFERSSEVTGLENDSDLEVLDLANWRLATHANPIQRVTVLEVKPRRDAANMIPALLALDIGYRVTVKRRPQGVGTALTYTMLVEGIEHSMTAQGEWACRLYLSGADSNATVQPLILDDATYGLLDTNVLAY